MNMNTKSPPPGRVVIRSYSPIVFLYPSLLAAILCGIWVTATGATPETPGASGLVFSLVLFVNLSIIAFDFGRLASILIVLVAVILGLLSTIYPGIGDTIRAVMDQPVFMNATFYWVWAVLIFMLIFLVFLKSRFDYWEIKNNELLHHHGFLGDVERWPAPGMRMSKEIHDVLEYLLCRSGRLVLVPEREQRAIVIDTVLNVNRVENQIQTLLSTLRVADGD
ncbi:MAG: hypothetical protein HUU55_01110 [Myxococcales bacterium]|nr:hypothetical protein [Myxococcales bacterium]